MTDSHENKDGQLILDFLQAIHAAEQRQAALDAQKFGEEKRIMKVKLIMITFCLNFLLI